MTTTQTRIGGNKYNTALTTQTVSLTGELLNNMLRLTIVLIANKMFTPIGASRNRCAVCDSRQSLYATD